MLSPQLVESLRRFVLPALASAALTAVTTYQATNDGKAAVMTGLIALLTPLAGAAGWGAYDGSRAAAGHVLSTDVGANLHFSPAEVAEITGGPPPSARGR